jgi:hypothetical protein
LPLPSPPATCSGHGSSPMKRRKAGVTDPVTGELIPFPYMPRVAHLPAGWRRLSNAHKIGHLLGMSLYRAGEILMSPGTELDHLQLSLRMQVWRVAFLFGIRAMLDGEFDRDAARERDRERRLEDLARRLGGAEGQERAATGA